MTRRRRRRRRRRLARCAKQDRAAERKCCRRQDHSWRAELIEQGNQREAPGRSAQQVRGVNDVDPIVKRVNAKEMTAPPVKNGSAASA